MKIILVSGIQNNHNSMTQLLVDKCIAGIQSIKPDAEIKIINLLETPIEFCIGCKKCGANDGKQIGTCVINDAMRDILPEMLTADRIIFASPIYDFSFSSLLKRMIERTLPLCIYPENSGPRTRNKPQKNKKGLILLVSDCPAPINWLVGLTWHASITLRMVCSSFGCASKKVISAGGMKSSSKLLKYFENHAFKEGQKFVQEK